MKVSLKDCFQILLSGWLIKIPAWCLVLYLHVGSLIGRLSEKLRVNWSRDNDGAAPSPHLLY